MTAPPAELPAVPPADLALTVAIPCYNHGEFLREAIASLESRPRDRCEVIIINDGSTDANTLAYFEELQGQGFAVIHQANLGLATARNTAIAAARGRYILPLDADNRLRPGYIERSIEILDRDPEVGVVYGDVEFFGDQIGRWELPDFDLTRLLLGNFIDACAAFRKSIWADCGGYDPHIPDQLGYEDWDFWLSVAALGWKFHHIPEVMYEYRVRSDSMVQACKRPENHKRLVYYFCQKHADLYAPRYAELIAEKDFTLLKAQEEADVVRSQLLQVQHDLDKAREQAGKLRAELAQLQGYRVDIVELRHEVEALRERVRWMESSKFWQLRSLWLRLKRPIAGLKRLFEKQRE